MFPERGLAMALRQTCAAAIELGLQRSSSARMRTDMLRQRKEQGAGAQGRAVTACPFLFQLPEHI